jgi:hypothetical protein
MAPMVYSRARRKLSREKSLMSKSSCQTPFKGRIENRDFKSRGSLGIRRKETNKLSCDKTRSCVAALRNAKIDLMKTVFVKYRITEPGSHFNNIISCTQGPVVWAYEAIHLPRNESHTDVSLKKENGGWYIWINDYMKRRGDEYHRRWRNEGW